MTKHDLEERTFIFAYNIRKFVESMPKTMITFDYLKQILRSSSSVSANYIEAQGGITKKDFIFRVYICRKEIKETIHWLRLLDVDLKPEIEEKRKEMLKEANELASIFTAVTKSAKGV